MQVFQNQNIADCNIYISTSIYLSVWIVRSYHIIDMLFPQINKENHRYARIKMAQVLGSPLYICGSFWSLYSTLQIYLTQICFHLVTCGLNSTIYDIQDQLQIANQKHYTALVIYISMLQKRTILLSGFPQNMTWYLKNHWTNTRLVCTHGILCSIWKYINQAWVTSISTRLGLGLFVLFTLYTKLKVYHLEMETNNFSKICKKNQ